MHHCRATDHLLRQRATDHLGIETRTVFGRHRIVRCADTDKPVRTHKGVISTGPTLFGVAMPIVMSSPGETRLVLGP